MRLSRVLLEEWLALLFQQESRHRQQLGRKLLHGGYAEACGPLIYHLTPRLAHARRNRELLAEWVEGHSGLVEWIPAAGGVCAFIHLVEVPDVDAFCHRLAREHGVLLVPGSCFGHPRHARLGFGGGSDSFLTGPSRLSHLLRSVSKEAGGWDAEPLEATSVSARSSR